MGFTFGYVAALSTVPTSVAVVSHPCSAVLDILDDANEVYLAVFLFSLYDGNECTDLIAQRLVSIARSGGHVEIFLDDSKSNWKAIKFFLENNVPVYVFKEHATLHAKVLLAGDCFILGSSNYTKSGFFRNAEINLKVCGPPSTRVRAWFDALRDHVRQITCSP